MRTVLVVAAEKFELEWIRQRTADRSDARFITVANGPGPKLAGAAADAAGSGVDSVVSTGLCGALDPSLRVGEIFVATTVNGRAASLPVTRRPYRSGPLHSVDRVVGSVDERRRLRAAGALAVEMEAAAVAERAGSWGRPFYCVRAVSDLAGEDFAVDLNAARDAAGRFSALRIVGQAALSPMRIVPELLRLRRNAKTAAKSLGDFFADCSF